MNWKQELKELKHKYLERTANGFYIASGGREMKLNNYKDSTANGLTNCIYDFLRFNEHYCNRINSTGLMRNIRGEMKWTKGTTNKGTADLFSIINSKAVSIEVKIGADKMSEAQHKEKKKIEDAGGIYLEVKDFPSFREWYKTNFE